MLNLGTSFFLGRPIKLISLISILQWICIKNIELLIFTRAFEQAGKAPGPVFGKEVNIDIEKIKKSKYFQVLLQQYNGGALNELGEQPSRQGKLISKPSKVTTPAKLASLYGDKIASPNSSVNAFAHSKTRSSEDCIIVEKPHFSNNSPKGKGISAFSRIDEEDRGHVNTLGAKRAHNEIKSPKQESARPSITEEANADVSGKGFVTAKAKLVCLLPISRFIILMVWLGWVSYAKVWL